MRIMGLDVGEKRIGVALSDELGFTAQGLGTIERSEPQEDIASLAELIGQWTVEKIVVGMPRNMNGTYGPQAEKVKEFAIRLEEETGVPLVYWDERLTTAAAERVLLAGDVSRKKRRGSIDKLAAVIILQGYLDAKR